MTADKTVCVLTRLSARNSFHHHQYVVNGQAESFDRTLDGGRTNTRNDFYNRQVTYANIPQLPSPIPDNVSYSRPSLCQC